MSKRMSRIFVSACMVVGLLVALAVQASAHRYHAGGGPDTVIGHATHGDILNGGAGCDVVAGRGHGDAVDGGYSGCDVVRGQDGNNDYVVTYNDGLAGDEAYGGAGVDTCDVNLGDYAGPSCNNTTVR